MARLTGQTVAEIQKDRVGAPAPSPPARQVTLVLKGQRTLHRLLRRPAFGSIPLALPAMGTGGFGDILTGVDQQDFLARSRRNPTKPLPRRSTCMDALAELGARALFSAEGPSSPPTCWVAGCRDGECAEDPCGL